MDFSNKRSDSDSQKAVIQHEIAILESILESKTKYRKIVQAAIGRWVRDFQDGKIEIRSVDDLRKLVELDIELQQDDL